MVNGSKNPDRDLLKPREALWSGDPDQTLTEAELDHILEHFRESASARDPQLRFSLEMQFQTFMAMAEKERLREQAGRPKQEPKSSTIVAEEMKRVQNACAKLDGLLAGLDPRTKTWLDQHLKEIGVKDECNRRVRWRHISERIAWSLDHLIHAAHSAEGMPSRGPNNMAQRIMVEKLADCWENSYGKPPTTDKGQGRRDDPFLELCQIMSGIAHTRLQKKGSGFTIRELSGLVDDVLRKRRADLERIRGRSNPRFCR